MPVSDRAVPAATLFAALSVIAIGLSACSSGAGAQISGGAPQHGGELTFAVLDAPSNLDPHSGGSYTESIITSNTADKLIWQDPDTGDLHPWLAESWEHNEDLTEFTFHLRDGVTFSDGSELDAQVVKENFDLLGFGDEELGVPPVSSYWAEYTGSEVLDESTVTAEFDSSQAGFPQALSHYFSGIVGAETLALSFEERKLPENIITTGPFAVTEHVYQERTVLTRREDYDWAPETLGHEGPAYLDEVELVVIPEASVRTGALQSGEVDAILDVQTTDEEVLEASGFTIDSQLIPGKDISFNFRLNKAPTDDLAVRKAIQLGWDRAALEQTVLTDSYAASTSVLGSRVPGWADQGEYLRYDEAEAARLLDEAGWQPGSDGVREKDGQRLSVDLLAINNLVVNRPAFELIQQNLADIGIELNLNLLPIPEWTAERAEQDKWNIVVFNTSRADAAVLDQTFSPEVLNQAAIGEDNPLRQETVDVLSRVNETLDPQERAEATAAAQEWIIGETALTSPVYNPAQVVASAPHVHGIDFEAQSRNVFLETWLGE